MRRRGRRCGEEQGLTREVSRDQVWVDISGPIADRKVPGKDAGRGKVSVDCLPPIAQPAIRRLFALDAETLSLHGIGST